MNIDTVKEVHADEDNQFFNGRNITLLTSTLTGECFKLPYLVKGENNTQYLVKEFIQYHQGSNHTLHIGFNKIINGVLVKGESWNLKSGEVFSLSECINNALKWMPAELTAPLVSFITTGEV